MEMTVRFKLFPLGFLVIVFGAIAADRDPIPPEILSGRTCEEHILQKARMTLDDFPKNVLGEHNAIVVDSYKLDGSGEAVDPKVVYAEPAKLFDKSAINVLGRTQFAAGAVEDSCYYLRTYSKARRSGR